MTLPSTIGRSGQPPEFQAIFESIPGLYLVLSPDFRIVAVSDAYLQATMTQRGQIIGRGLFDVFPDNPDDPAASGTSNLRASLERVLTSGQPDAMAVQKYDIKRPANQGGGFEERYWSPVNSPVVGTDGKVLYIIHRVEDVTDFLRLRRQQTAQEQITEDLRTRASEMEVEVFQRAQELQRANSKLRAANEELAKLYQKTQELDRAKTRFFDNISHELRTPLTLILSPIRHRLRDAPDSDQIGPHVRQELESVERNAGFLLRRVNDLLDLASVDAGKSALNYASVDLSELARSVLSFFELAAAARGVKCELDAPPTSPIEADPDKLQRVLLNLLSNAFKFTPDRGIVRISISRRDEGLNLRVEDSGPGIPPDKRELVFERFRKLDADTTSRASGTGLGLSIVKEFVELHGGSSSVQESSLGGAAFHIALPAQAPAGTKVASAPRHDDALTRQAVEEVWPVVQPLDLPSAAGPEAPLVLLVEDHPEMRRILSTMLSPLYRVASAVDGQDGLNKALTIRPDLIISDIMMPTMSGDDLFHRLRSHPALQAVPVMFLTASHDRELRTRLLEAGANEFIEKPFSPREVLARVRKLIEARRTAQERFRHIVESSPGAIIGIDQDHHVALVNAQAERLFGISRSAALGASIFDLFPTAAHKQIRTIIKQAAPAPTPPITWELTARHSVNGQFPVDIHASRLNTEDGILTIAFVSDITERKRAERRQRLMMDELDHRVRNNLAVVLALSSQTMQQSSTLQDFEVAFKGRIAALARLHSTLAQSRWEGTHVHELVMLALEGYVAQNSHRISIDGPDLIVPGRHGQSLCLALHELTTNAVKYGALSTTSGRVAVNWTIEPSHTGGRSLTLSWKEFDGPKVTTPTRKSFGRTLIEESLPYELRAKSILSFLPDGVSCTIVAPLPNPGEPEEFSCAG